MPDRYGLPAVLNRRKSVVNRGNRDFGRLKRDRPSAIVQTFVADAVLASAHVIGRVVTPLDHWFHCMMPLLADGTISGYLAEAWKWPEVWALVAAATVHAILLGTFFGLPAFVGIWAERKVAGRIQDRLGPTRVGGRFGWLQSLADGVKLIQKEDLWPTAADAMLFRVAPYVVVIASFSAFLFLPFSKDWVAISLDVGLFLALAILSLEVLGIILAGYSSGSKWSLFGGMREAAQMVSYEVPLGITAVIPVMIAGTMNLNEIGRMQSGWFWNWFLFRDPFTMLAFFVFFTVTLASNKRAPFDLAEAESELVGGFHTEYSGMRWSFFFLAEYASMYFVSALGAILFLGGWWTGLPFIDDFFRTSDSAAVQYLGRVLGFAVLMIKTSKLVFLQIWVRWTLPRLRIDQVMQTCLKYLVPISCFLFLGATAWSLWFPGRVCWFLPGLGNRVVEVSSVNSTGAVETSAVSGPLFVAAQEGPRATDSGPSEGGQ